MPRAYFHGLDKLVLIFFSKSQFLAWRGGVLRVTQGIFLNFFVAVTNILVATLCGEAEMDAEIE